MKEKMLKILFWATLFAVGHSLGLTQQSSMDKTKNQSEIAQVKSDDYESCKAALGRSTSDCNTQIKKATNNCQASQQSPNLYFPGECYQEPGVGGIMICP